MALSLRPYQTEALDAVRSGVRRGIRRPLVSLPTGTGKTILFSAMASGALARSRGVLVLAHRDELLAQAADKMRQFDSALSELVVGLVKAESDQWDYPVVVASVQTLARERRLARVDRRFDLVIVDEAHHAAADSYQRILDGVGSFDPTGPITLGVTATPQRADALTLETTFQEIVYHRDILSMIRSGYLCDLVGRQVRLAALDLSKARTRRGDFVEGEVGEMLEAAEAPLHGVRAWRKYAEGRKTIVFTPTIALAHEFADEFRAKGVAARALSGETPLDERRGILRDFHAGDVEVVCNAQVLTEGFDEPSVECILIARPTKSQPLYIQMIGRGTRLWPGKENCLVLDLVGATERLDLTTLPRLFGLGDDESYGDVEEALAERGVSELAGLREERLVREGRITAKEVSLFGAQKFAWVKVREGAWSISTGDDTMIFVMQTGGGEGDERYAVDRRPRYGAPERIATNLDLGYAMGVAEDAARTTEGFAEVLVSRDARWRGAPATDKQLAALKRMRVAAPAGCSKGEAADLLGAAIARRRVSQ
jgi:superfamily II DNA or RNA helicase